MANISRIAASGACLLAGTSPGAAADPPFRITGFTGSAGGHARVTFPTVTGNYYLLRRASTLEGPWQAVSMIRGTGENLPLTDPGGMGGRAFYRVGVRSVSSPLDSDGDGLGDLTEFAEGGLGNPFNPASPPAPEDAAVILRSRAMYEQYAHRDNFPGAADVREVKFLITGADTAAPRLYFLNTNKHQFHYYFAQEVLGYEKDLGTFNNETYFSDSRKFMAGSLVAYDHYGPPGQPATGLYGMEFWPSDGVKIAHVTKAYDLVSRALPWMTARFAYHPAGTTQEQLLKAEAAAWAVAPVDVITSGELFADTAYSVLNPGISFGRLVLGGGTQAVTARDVVVLPSIPADLSRVAGIITAAPQTPLSHINLKAKQNKTPNAYLRGAMTDPRITALAGKNVRLEVAADGLQLREATQQEVDTYLDALRPKTPQYPVRDLSVTTIRALKDVPFAASSSVGAKAANVAELRRLLSAGMSPDGFAVPFQFYDEFMKFNGFYDQARALMADPVFQSDPGVREQRLAAFRETIMDGNVPDVLRNALSAVQIQFAPGVPIRCRSSTNNEDLPGFNGAGLYDSNTHRPDEGSLHKSVRKVWASLWNFRAFEERDFYRIDHFTAAMGVLLHPNTDEELANGVGVTKNLIDPNWRGYYVNVQKGEELVTNPDGSVIPEEFLIAWLMGETPYEIQHVTWSSLQPAQTSLLTTAQAYDLADRMSAIQNHFRSLYNSWSDPDFAMELEFKITKEDKLFIKQARPWVE
ncbi:MAG: PEP/pyruvate-binding domain-containing protein [Verrucomicrobiota bacterium]